MCVCVLALHPFVFCATHYMYQCLRLCYYIVCSVFKSINEKFTDEKTSEVSLSKCKVRQHQIPKGGGPHGVSMMNQGLTAAVSLCLVKINRSVVVLSVVSLG